ncbi:uncharacterized protein LOC143371413 [Andrena cerasifolii]|uniref:uncharacterized protein LOC143371413 n=1 Tax=Andrena cerasifolii TaxID=2819439 RepID=UPI004037E3BD
MDFAGYQYYKSSQKLLEVVGLWPYQKATWLMQAWRLLIAVLLINSTTLQMTTCVTHECDSRLLLKMTPYLIVTIVFALKYLSFYLQLDKMKVLFDNVQCDWSMLENEHEIQIMKNYAEIAKFLSTGLANTIIHVGTRRP